MPNNHFFEFRGFLRTLFKGALSRRRLVLRFKIDLFESKNQRLISIPDGRGRMTKNLQKALVFVANLCYNEGLFEGFFMIEWIFAILQ